jgi:hypothetical protein
LIVTSALSRGDDRSPALHGIFAQYTHCTHPRQLPIDGAFGRESRYAAALLQWRQVMAKGQAKSNKETRKPKAAKPPKPNASKPSTK